MAFTIRSFAIRSPFSTRLASATSSAAVSRVWRADLGQEELEAVGDDAGRGEVEVDGLVGARSGALLDLDVGGRERSPELAQRLVAEIVLELKRVQLVGAHAAALLRIGQEAGEAVVRELVVQGVGAQGRTLVHVPPNEVGSSVADQPWPDAGRWRRRRTRINDPSTASHPLGARFRTESLREQGMSETDG